jgi:hypothetical protein
LEVGNGTDWDLWDGWLLLLILILIGLRLRLGLRAEGKRKYEFMKDTTYAELTGKVKRFFEDQQAALNGALEKLPEALRTQFSGVKESINNILKDLPPTDQVPAALDASYVLQHFASMFERIQDYTARLSGMMDGLTAKATAMHELDAKVKAGELLEKAAVQDLIEQAREAGAAQVRPEIIATRKTALELAGLPAAPENVLELSAADFDTARSRAQKNVEALKAKGLSLTGKGAAFVSGSAWLPETEFAGRLGVLEELAPVTPPPPKTGGRGAGDPLVGAAEAADAAAQGGGVF